MLAIWFSLTPLHGEHPATVFERLSTVSVRGIYKVFLTCGSTAIVIAGGVALLGWFEPLTQAFYGPTPAGRPLSGWWQGVGILLLGLGLAWSACAIVQRSLKLVVMAVALVEVAALAWVFHLYGLVWPPFATLMAGLLGGGLVFAWGFTPKGRREEAIARFFDHRLSPASGERLRGLGTPLPLAGERREVTVVVAEWLDRDRLAPQLSPEAEVAFLERWKTIGGETLKAEGGLLLDDGADRLVALFGAIQEWDETPPLTAAAASLALQRSLEVLAQEAAAQWQIDPHFGIGMESGEATVAIYHQAFGSVGPVHAVAHWLASANARCGSKILLGPAIKAATSPPLEVMPMGTIQWKGEERELFEWVALPEPVAKTPQTAPEPTPTTS